MVNLKSPSSTSLAGKILAVLVAGLPVAACQPAQERTLDPETLAEEFAASGARVAGRYRQAWEGHGLTALDRATLAGELLRADARHSDEYLSYLKRAVDAEDPTISAAALSSLRNGSDDEVLDILARMATSSRHQVARAAGHSLDFKRQQVAGGAISGDEANLVLETLAELCRTPSLASYVRELTCR
jgi:hypothetical protein